MTPPTSFKRRIATAALPYANGDIHVGHLVEYLQVDFWTRFQKLIGNDCLYICADDTHGTPIMVKAKEMGVSPEEWIATNHKKHLKDFRDFEIEFDEFGSTHSDQNKEIAFELFQHLQDQGLIYEKKVEQLYDPSAQMFLPDRFVKGECPKCGSKDQYGDSCDACGATYSPSELRNPKSTVSGATPELKETAQLFLNLSERKEFLKEWIPLATSPEMSRKLFEWFESDLKPWDISRNGPYFGFEIPGFPGKYFYVWFDAPIGYISTTKVHCQRTGKSFASYWQDPTAERFHFIGKDIMNFHCIFWPSVLKDSPYCLPTKVFCHGMLTVNGEKMSKSKGTSILARTYLDHLSPTYLRYYYATKLVAGLDDYDLNFDDFVGRVNSELLGKITNLASRGATMLHKNFGGVISSLDDSSLGIELVEAVRRTKEDVATWFESREFAKGLGSIRDLAVLANRYFDEKAPWKLVKENPEAAHRVLSTTLYVFRSVAIFLKPILPSYVLQVEFLYREKQPMTWASLSEDLTGRSIEVYSHLLKPMSLDSLKKIQEQSL